MHWRRKWQPTPVFLPGESQGRGSLVGCHLWGCTELNTTEATWQQQQQQGGNTVVKEQCPWGTSLVVQWLRFHAPNARGLGPIPAQGTGSHVLQLGLGTTKENK